MNKEIFTFSIQPGEIHVWVFNLEGFNQDHHFWEETLAEEELDRSKHYLFEQDRLRFVAGRSNLRRLLSLYTGIAPAEINYQTNQFGKLSIPLNPISFNNSNSHDRIAFAFTLEAEIGVDIEQVHSIPDLSDLMEFHFSQEERTELSTLPPATKIEAFYTVWTQKEAFLKARGMGLTLSMQDFSVSADPDKCGMLMKFKDGDASHYQMVSHATKQGYRVAVCARMKDKPHVRWFMPNLTKFLSGNTQKYFDQDRVSLR